MGLRLTHRLRLVMVGVCWYRPVDGSGCEAERGEEVIEYLIENRADINTSAPAEFECIALHTVIQRIISWLAYF